MRQTTGLLSSSALSGSPMGGSGVGPSQFVGTGGDQENSADESSEQPNVSPQEQQQYDAFVKNGMQIIYTPDGKVNPEVVKRLSTGKKYMDTLAQTSVWLVMMLEQNAKQAGTDISDDVVMHGGRELFEQLLEVDEALGIHKFKEAEVQGAWYQALDLYRDGNSDQGDRFDPNGGGQQAAQDFLQLNEADQQGRADEVVPGFYKNVESAFASAKADENKVDDQGNPINQQEQDKSRLNDKVTGRG